MTGSRRPAFASDDWMLEQQMRAEMEAEAWRRLRGQLAPPPEPQPAPTAPGRPDAPDFHRSGSAMLKALVRFGLAAFFAYLAYLAAVDGGLGEFEAWLAIGATFVATLAMSMFDPMRGFVLVLAETMRWVIIATAGLGAVWLMLQMSA